MVSLGIFSVVPPAEPCALRSTQPGISPGVKAAGAFGWRPTALAVKKVRGLNLLGIPWATSACRKMVCPYGRLSAWSNSAPTGRIVMKFYIWVLFSKKCRENSSFIKIWQQQPVLYMKTNILFWSHLAQFFLEWEMFQTKVVQKIKTHISCPVPFFGKSCRLWDNVEKYFRVGQATDDSMTHALCIQDNWGYKHTITICNTRVDVTSHVHCLSAYTKDGVCLLRGTNWIFNYNSD